MTAVPNYLNFTSAADRPDFYRFHNGEKAPLQFAESEYEARVAGLRKILIDQGVEAAVFTSMHNISYYSGFTYCSFGRPYGLVVTASDCVTISAGIDAGQPWRRCYGDNITYTDWQRDNFWRAIRSVTGEGKVIGYESDHLTLLQQGKLEAFLKPSKLVDLYEATMRQNATTHVTVSAPVLRAMLAQEPDADGARGAIVNMGSVLATEPVPELFATHAYAAAKGAVAALTITAAAYYAPYGIRINMVAPALTISRMSERAQADEATQAFSRRKQPLAGGRDCSGGCGTP